MPVRGVHDQVRPELTDAGEDARAVADIEA